MAQEPKITVQFFASGYCLAHEKIVNPKTGKGKCKFYAVWALIHVPSIGYILFDTGYSNAFMQATQSFPDRFYRWATPVFLKEDETVKNTLLKKGIQPNDIKYVILSHFHADHLAGLIDFPDAQIICSKIAHDEVRNLRGFKAVSKGILHKLLPEEYESRLLFIEDIADKKEVNNQGLEEFWFLSMQELRLVSLPGHARGMLGFILQNEAEHIFYAADASWRYETYQQNINPKKIVKLFFDSWKDFVLTQEKIKHYENDHKNVKVLFTHCPLTLELIKHVI